MADVSDEAFARYVNQIGNATLEQIEAAKAAQVENANKGVLLSLGDVLVQQGILTAAMRENVEKKLQAQASGGLKQLGKYKLIKKLGEGGMGAVYLAEDTAMDRKVALKVLPKKHAADAEFMIRFRREAQATGKLNHVNIIAAHDAGEDMGHHFYAMEYCDGEPLDAQLKRESFLPWDKAIEIVMQVARGLKHAHEHGFIHRDIKPANIFITKDGVAKILDLGLSKNIGDSAQSFNTQTGVAMGTPHYISPEQARGDKGIDGRTDIYSLGATFYHLVTGQTPFQASTAMAIMMKHLNEQLPNPQDLNEGIPDGIVQIIQKMMAKEPADRYRDCKELLDDLELVIDGKMPSSHAIDVGKSSVAIRRTARPLGTRRQEPVPPRGRAGTGPQAPLTPRRSSAERREANPSRESNKKLPLYIAAGVAVLGLAVLLFAFTRPNQNSDAAQNGAAAQSGAGVSAREAEQKKQAEDAARLADEKRKAEDTRLKAEAARLEEEKRKLAEDKRKAEEAARLAAEAAKKKAVDDAKVAAATQAVKPPDEAIEKVLGPAPELTLNLGGVKMELVLVKAGEFMMGSDNEGGNEEKPAHKVKISNPFYMAKYVVTVAQFRAFADATKYQTEAEKSGEGWTWKDGKWQGVKGCNWRTPGFPQEDNYPACMISWNDTQEFLKWAVKQTGRKVSLPTEARWEYTCRAGTTTRYNAGDKESDLEQAAWFNKNSGMHTHAVGQKKANAWGLFDMHGNVWEWMQDKYDDKYYANSPAVDPPGSENGGDRVLRGGSWDHGPGDCRSARRHHDHPGHRDTHVGFRLALDF